MVEYEQIKSANREITTIDFKGKAYAEVNQRINAFRKVEPNGSIETEIVSLDNGVCVMKATVRSSEGFVLGTGHAYEKESSSYINKTSYIENCETSAIGRALGMCGFGIDTSISSYDEVSNASKSQKGDKSTNKAPKKVVDKMTETFKKTFGIEKEVLEQRIGKPIEESTDDDINVLRQIFTSLSSKETTISDWFSIDGKSNLGSRLD